MNTDDLSSFIADPFQVPGVSFTVAAGTKLMVAEPVPVAQRT